MKLIGRTFSRSYLHGSPRKRRNYLALWCTFWQIRVHLSDWFYRKNGKHAPVLLGESNNDLDDIDFDELECSAKEI
jgi:hypothetical protein